MPPVPGRDTVAVPGEGFVDVARSKALWTTVYEAPKAFIRRGDWVDQPSVMIPGLYVLHGSVLASVLQANGDAAGARAVEQTTRQVARVANLEDLVRQSVPLVPAPADTAAGTAIPLTQP
jgi:hypothetical protein